MQTESSNPHIFWAVLVGFGQCERLMLHKTVGKELTLGKSLGVGSFLTHVLVMMHDKLVCD